MNQEPRDRSIDLELEARIVALVLGEASDFERDQLSHLIEERPELAEFKEEIQSVHGLLEVVTTGETMPSDDDWKLPSERRNALLTVLSGQAEQQPAIQLSIKPAESRQAKQRRILRSLSTIAAVLLVAAVLGSLAIPSVQTARMASRATDSRSELMLDERSSAATSAPMFQGGTSIEGRIALPEEVIDSEHASNLARSAIRGRLGSEADQIRHYYLQDDVQYFPAESGFSKALAEPESPQIESMKTESYRFESDPVDLERAESAKTDPVEYSGRASGASTGDSAPTAETQPARPEIQDFDEGVPPGAPAASTDLSYSRNEIRNGNQTWSYESRRGVARGGAAGLDEGSYALLPTFNFQSVDNDSQRFGDEYKKGDVLPQPDGLAEKNALEEPYSTFSLHVSDVSFKLARAALAAGTWPEPEQIRIEEFVNALDYGDPMPRHHEKVAARVEQSVHPFLQQRNLLRISMRTAAAGRASNTPLRLTLLVDNSGSMERIDRQQTIRRAFALLAQQLQPIDQVTLISFARQPRLLADQVSGSQSDQLVEIIDNLPSEGGTNIEAALLLAFEKAMEHRVESAQNRVILLTDGAVNLGDADPESLSQLIATMRGAGIAFDAAGISAEGLNDEILEALTRKGDGRYYLLDSIEAADDGFARQIAGALRPSAKNVKVQVEFNPKRVGHYKLLGFEKHLLQKEDFRNDKVDAAEMAAAEAGVAVYQFEARPDGEGDVGSVSVRFRDLSTGQMIENRWPIPYEHDAPRLDQATPSLRIAASAALLAAKLRGDALGESVDLKTLSNLIAGLPQHDRSAPRVQELQQMIEQARQMSGK